MEEEQLQPINESSAKPPKNHNKRNIVIAVIITALVTAPLTAFVQSKIAVYMPMIAEKSDLNSKIACINEVLDKRYLYDTDKSKLTEDAITAYVEGLDEPYTHYYSPQKFTSYMSHMQDSYVGIGVVISTNKNNEIEVVSPFEDSNAYKAGIKPGDIIKAVDGKEFSGEEMEDAVSYIKGGKAGTKVKLLIVRDGGEPFEIEVERGNVSAESVKTEMLADNIGYVRITAFNAAEENSSQDTYTEFKEKVGELQNQSMKGMIIDLRDNPGGSLEVVCNIADMLVPEGTITYMEYKDGKRETFTSDSNEIDVPMAVLINGNSASASEVLTGCLKDYQKAVVIGKKSYGKGIVQSVYPFADGSGMSLTVAKYYSPNGVCIHGTGIEPNYEVDLPEKYSGELYYASEIPRDEDTQFMRAVSEVKEKLAEK